MRTWKIAALGTMVAGGGTLVPQPRNTYVAEEGPFHTDRTLWDKSPATGETGAHGGALSG